jgi:hypothetical protein
MARILAVRLRSHLCLLQFWLIWVMMSFVLLCSLRIKDDEFPTL